MSDCDLLCKRSAYDRIPRLSGVLNSLQIVPIEIFRSVDTSTQIASGQKHKTAAIAAPVADLIDSRGPRRGAAAAEPHIAGHRHAEHSPAARRWRFSQAHPRFCDRPIEFGIVLACWWQDLHHFKPVSQRDWPAVTESSLKIPIERDARHQCAVPVPMRAVAYSPCWVIRVLVGRIESGSDQGPQLRPSVVSVFPSLPD